MRSKVSKPLIGQCLLLIQLFIFSSLCWAKEGGVLDGGGGDALILSDDTVILADSYAKVEHSDEGEIIISSTLKKEIEKSIRIMGGYWANEVVLSNAILGENNIFYGVEDLPTDAICNNRLTYINTPESSHLNQVACTINNKTWIKEKLFSKMTVREQALTIVHEGLRRKFLMNSDISNITNGLRIALDYYQKQIKGDYSKLKDPEKVLIKNLFRSALAASWDYTNKERQLKSFVDSYNITDHGGLISAVSTSSINLEAVVGIGSRIGIKQNKIEKDSLLLLTNICEYSTCLIKQGVRVVETNSISYTGKTESTGVVIINAGSEIIQSILGNSNGQVEIGKNVLIKASHLNSEKLQVFDDAKIEQVTLLRGIYTVKNNITLKGISILNTSSDVVSVNFESDILADNFICKQVGKGTFFYKGVNKLTISSIDNLKSKCF